MNNETMAWLTPSMPEWDRAWAALAADPLNSDLAVPTEALDAETGEAWQYMGTYLGRHEFRHRMHPSTGRREILRLAAGVA